MTDGTLQAPVPLADHHDVEAFASGAATLNAWIRRKARANQASGASRTYVLCRGDKVVGFYALAAGSISHDLSPRKLRQNMPDPVPVGDGNACLMLLQNADDPVCGEPAALHL